MGAMRSPKPSSPAGRLMAAAAAVNATARYQGVELKLFVVEREAAGAARETGELSPASENDGGPNGQCAGNQRTPTRDGIGPSPGTVTSWL